MAECDAELAAFGRAVRQVREAERGRAWTRLPPPPCLEVDLRALEAGRLGPAIATCDASLGVTSIALLLRVEELDALRQQSEGDFNAIRPAM